MDELVELVQVPLQSRSVTGGEFSEPSRDLPHAVIQPCFEFCALLRQRIPHPHPFLEQESGIADAARECGRILAHLEERAAVVELSRYADRTHMGSLGGTHRLNLAGGLRHRARHGNEYLQGHGYCDQTEDPPL